MPSICATDNDLCEMFASFNEPFRKKILTELDVAIKATEKDLETYQSSELVNSITNLNFMKRQCQRAQEEFAALSKKEG